MLGKRATVSLERIIELEKLGNRTIFVSSRSFSTTPNKTLQ